MSESLIKTELPFVLQASILCEAVTRDLAGRLSILNLLEKIPTGIMETFILIHIWVCLRPDTSEYLERLTLIGPDGDLLAYGESNPFMLNSIGEKHINYLRFSSIPFKCQGLYEIRTELIRLDDKTVFVYPEQPLIVC